MGVAELYAILRLRQEVFVVEQDCAYLDADGGDEVAMHLRGYDDDALVAYLRAFPPSEDGCVHIGRVIVVEAVRGRGLGQALMTRGADLATAKWGPHPIHLSAQAHLEPFYASLGYVATGPGYLEDGIPHLPMRRPQPGG
ncbi:MAG: GNAT family N-acetyltransferase [Myxococcota bacterium]